MSGKNLIKAGHTTNAARGCNEANGGSNHNVAATGIVGEPPKITLHRNNDTIEAIEITCPCGRTMIVECEYAEEKTS